MSAMRPHPTDKNDPKWPMSVSMWVKFTAYAIEFKFVIESIALSKKPGKECGKLKN